MGIKGLTKLLTTSAPNCIKQCVLSKYTGRTVAVDASMLIYQFLVAIRSNGPQYGNAMLMNAQGEVTSHIQGMFTRTIRLMEHGIRPVFVFDGKPPEMKSGELEKRKENRDKAEIELEKAKEEGNTEEIDKLSKRTVHMNQDHIQDCIKLLEFMGIPIVISPSEAESQCAELVKKDKVWAMASEDMDSLTFGVPRLLRHLTQSEGKENDILEFDHAQLLSDLNIDQDAFIDLCILCGCDYCDSIRGIGPVRALQFIQQYKSIDEIIKHIDKTKYPLPDNWLYKESHKLFTNPDVTPGEDIKIEFKTINKEGLINYLVNDKGFNEERVKNQIARLEKAKDKSTQRRMDSFFTITPKDPNTVSKKKTPEKKTVISKKKGRK
ncbi:hypothetical protein WA158_003812 [Blastocystis sp. Blastoise]